MAADCALDSVDQVRVYYLPGAYCIIEFSRHFLIVLGPKTRLNNVDFFCPRYKLQRFLFFLLSDDFS